MAATTKIWRDTIRTERCRGCGQRIWWAQIAKSGLQMAFNAQPVAIVTEVPLGSNRELLTVDTESDHHETCTAVVATSRRRR